jgi:hypothetical protein
MDLLWVESKEGLKRAAFLSNLIEMARDFEKDESFSIITEKPSVKYPSTRALIT